jgi:hypothetical protein
MNWWTIIIVAIILITLDKGITAMNIKAVEKHHPEVEDPFSIEKNPLANKAFHKFGLFGGTVIYWIFSLATFFFALYMFSFPAGAWAPENKWGVSLYVMMMFYAFVIMNNAYFFLRYSKLL